MRIVEKPTPEEAPSNVSSLPLYCFGQTLLAYLPEIKPSARGEYELQDAIQMLIEHGGMVCGVTAPGRLTLTSPADLLRINRHFLVEGGGEVRVPAHAIGEGTRLVPPLYIESGSQIGAGCTIGPQVVIERDCRIGDEVSLQKAVLLRGVSIPAGSKILNQVVS